MVRHGSGAKCSPRSSAAGSYSTGLRTNCPFHATSTLVVLGTFVACEALIDLAGAACAAARLVNAASVFNARNVRVLVFVLLARIIGCVISLFNLLFAT